MNRNLKKLLIVTLVVGLSTPAIALAARSTGGLMGQNRLRPGKPYNVHRPVAQQSNYYGSNYRSQPAYCYPAAVRTQPAPYVERRPVPQQGTYYEAARPTGSYYRPVR